MLFPLTRLCRVATEVYYYQERSDNQVKPARLLLNMPRVEVGSHCLNVALDVACLAREARPCHYVRTPDRVLWSARS